MQSEDHAVTWLYDEVVQEWAKLLPESSRATIMHGGFYSVLLKPGFRLISVNTNYCHSLNW